MPEATKTPAAPDAAGPSKALSPDDLVRVYNKAKRAFTHEIYENDKKGRKPQKWTAAPNAFITIPRWLAELWTGRYPEDLIPGDTALNAIDPRQAAFIAMQEKYAVLEGEKAALEAEVADLKAQLTAAQG